MFAPTSNSIYEKKHIERFIREYGKDPMTGQPLTIDKLVTIPIQHKTVAHRNTAIATADLENNGPLLHKELVEKINELRSQVLAQRNLIFTAQTFLNRSRFQGEVCYSLLTQMKRMMPPLQRTLKKKRCHAGKDVSKSETKKMKISKESKPQLKRKTNRQINKK